MIFKKNESRKKFRIFIAVICIVAGVCSLQHLPMAALMFLLAFLYGYRGIKG